MALEQISLCELQGHHEAELATLFAAIHEDPASRYFHPHPFSAEEATRICQYAGKDLYLMMCVGGAPVGYGLLRGWDAGYAVPSLGIFVVSSARGTGAAKILMEYMHYCARLRGAPAVRLKVYEANKGAARLYTRLGYVFADDLENGQLVGKLELRSPTANGNVDLSPSG